MISLTHINDKVIERLNLLVNHLNSAEDYGAQYEDKISYIVLKKSIDKVKDGNTWIAKDIEIPLKKIPRYDRPISVVVNGVEYKGMTFFPITSEKDYLRVICPVFDYPAWKSGYTAGSPITPTEKDVLNSTVDSTAWEDHYLFKITRSPFQNPTEATLHWALPRDSLIPKSKGYTGARLTEACMTSDTSIVKSTEHKWKKFFCSLDETVPSTDVYESEGRPTKDEWGRFALDEYFRISVFYSPYVSPAYDSKKPGTNAYQQMQPLMAKEDEINSLYDNVLPGALLRAEDNLVYGTGMNALVYRKQQASTNPGEDRYKVNKLLRSTDYQNSLVLTTADTVSG